MLTAQPRVEIDACCDLAWQDLAPTRKTGGALASGHVMICGAELQRATKLIQFVIYWPRAWPYRQAK